MGAFVTSARGSLVNFDQLIEQSKRPLNAPPQAATEVKKRANPRQAINVRGHRPAVPEAIQGPAPDISAVQAVPAQVPPPETPSAYTGTTATSMADLTGIKVDKQKATKGLKKEDVKKIRPEEAVDVILHDLENATFDKTGYTGE